MKSLFPCGDPENSVGGGGRADNVFETSTLFTDDRSDLSREAIGPVGSNCF